MPIAATLFYFQRRRPPPMDPAQALSRDSSAARRRLHPHRSAHHTLGYEVAQGSQRECGVSSGSIIEPMSNMLFSSRLSTNVSNDRLPDAVQQAKERLHQRLRSVEFFPGRRKTVSAMGTGAGPNLPSEADICTYKDERLDDLIIGFNYSAFLPTQRVKETIADSFSDMEAVAPHLRPVSKVGQETLDGTIEGNDVESYVDCSICLEGCRSAADGLMQLRCKHIFHKACLEQWLQSRADCPYCRTSVVVTQKRAIRCRCRRLEQIELSPHCNS